MHKEDKYIYEILKELLKINKKIEAALNKLADKHFSTHDEISNQFQDQGTVLKQMGDYVAKDFTKQNERLMKRLARGFRKASKLIDPNIIGMNRPNNKIISMTSIQKLTINSTNSADSKSGAGVQKVLVKGLGASGARQTDLVVLNGINNVLTTDTFAQIDAFSSIATGSNNGAVGTINLRGASDSTIYAVIQQGNNAWR